MAVSLPAVLSGHRGVAACCIISGRVGAGVFVATSVLSGCRSVAACYGHVGAVGSVSVLWQPAVL